MSWRGVKLEIVALGLAGATACVLPETARAALEIDCDRLELRVDVPLNDAVCRRLHLSTGDARGDVEMLEAWRLGGFVVVQHMNAGTRSYFKR